MPARSFRFTSNWRLLSTAVLLVLCLGLVSAGSASAVTSSATSASSYSITMTPSSTELQAPPGGSTTSSFSTINEGKTGYNMTLSIAPYRIVGDNYKPQFTLLPGKTDASKWVHLSAPLTQYLPAGLPQKISYSLNVPAGTTPGGYYAVLFAETEPPTNKSGVTAHNRVGDILYITVEGPVLKQGSVVATHLPRLELGNSLPISLIVRDSGGLHFLTTVTLSAKSSVGSHTAYEASLQRYVLPQTERLVSATWTSLPLLGIYKISRSATVFGHSQSLPSQQVIIIRPWLLILIILLVVAVILLLTQQVFRHRDKTRKGEPQQTGGSS